MMRKSNAPLVLNSLFWAVICVIMGIIILNSSTKHDINEYYLSIGLFGLFNVSIFYINYIFLIPELIKKRKKYWLYIISFLFLLSAVVLLKTVVAVLNPEDLLRYTIEGKRRELSIINFVINSIFINGFFLVSSCIIKFSIDYFANERANRNLESERLEMELQFLKSQLNPHFLFNSLNNIYSLAYQKSDKTADAVMKLSEIMRYMIYESNDTKVLLSKELDYLRNYIELQNIRFKDGVYIELNINGKVEDQKIIPLMLIAFVENTFKHGIVNDPENPVKIDIIANPKILRFSVVNKKNKQNKDGQGGVGLVNVERRLQLSYPDRYKLNVVNSETHYSCDLMIDI